MYEVILFYGPRHSGKTAYYRQQLAGTHARVSADEVYRRKPSANLHVVIKQFINTLKEKRLIVVDDENWSAETRQSYIKAINKQEFADGCKISCFEFSPYHGKQQCLWAAQWALASQEAWLINHTYAQAAHADDKNTISITYCYVPNYAKATNAVYQSFTSKSSVRPSKAEGFAEVCNIESHLMCISQYEFTIPALLIQWECLVGVAGSALIEACHHWQTVNTEGRIITVCNNQNNTHNDWKEHIQHVCKFLGKYPQLVIYYVIFAGTLSHMIAWLQFRHTIALYHSATVYVWSSESHRDCVKSLGIVNMNVDHINTKPKAITCVHHSADGPPLMLKKFIYCCPDTQQYSAVEQDSGINIDTYINTWTSTGASRSDMSKNYQVPLLELAYRLHQCDTSIDSLSFHFDSKRKHCSVESSSSGAGWYHVLSDVDNYCMHGLLYKNWTDLCQYQQHTMDKIVIVTNKNCSACFMKKSCGDNMKEKEKKPAPTSCVPLPFVPAKKHKPTAGLLSPRNNRSGKRVIPLPVITHEELLSHAKDASTYARAEAYQDNVFDVNCTPNCDDDFVVTGQCHGTGIDPYKSECIVDNTGLIVGSSCSCHVGSTNGGKCKHVIAMLLVFIKQQVTKARTQALPVMPVTRTRDEEKEIGTLTKHRSLPKWASEVPPPTENERPLKRKLSSDTKKPKCYKMSDEDFVRTALEILEEEPDVIADTPEQPSLVIPSTDEQPVGSCDSSPLIGGSEERICSPVSQMEYDDPTQEVEYTGDDISLSPDRGLNHHHGNSGFTDEMGERIESSLFCDNTSRSPTPIHDTHDDKPSDTNDSLLDELFN